MSREKRRMHELRHAQICLRKSLTMQEETNAKLRSNIAVIWNKGYNSQMSTYANELALGRAKIRAFQYALGDVKKRIKMWNKKLS